MEPEVIVISSDEDNSSGDTEPFPGPGAAGRPRDPRQGREYYRRERQEGPPRQVRHTLFSRRTGIMERLDGMVLLMAVEVTTMFVEAPFARNSPPYAEEPASSPLASHSAQSSEPATPTAAGEMDEEESAPFGTEERIPPAQDVEAVGEEISPSAGDAESPPTEVPNGTRANDGEADPLSLDPEPLVGRDPSTEDEPEFRRRFATHRLEVDPVRQFPRITLRYLPKVPVVANKPHLNPAKREWGVPKKAPAESADAAAIVDGEPPGASVTGVEAIADPVPREHPRRPRRGFARRPRSPKDRSGACRVRPASARRVHPSSGRITAATRSLLEEGIPNPGRYRLRVGVQKREKDTGEALSGNDDTTTMPPSPELSSATECPSSSIPKTPTDSELWEDIVGLFDWIDGWDTSLESVLDEEPELDAETDART
ncbi:uncharacterized protein Dvir_GJ25932 [Drosophila virilis]|uniref:Uncharacterized protein n=1 Tax=Drosophila virilis TaxID=7244 RepID=A0A0Q9WBI6_DROVI|nr:uncharacterized protein Dvir_GJ25932 [Drosophila virilis]